MKLFTMSEPFKVKKRLHKGFWILRCRRIDAPSQAALWPILNSLSNTIYAISGFIACNCTFLPVFESNMFPSMWANFSSNRNNSK